MMRWGNLAAGLALVAATSNAAAAPSNIDRALSCKMDWRQTDAALAALKRVDDAPPKLPPLQALAHPEIQRFDEWQALGTREDRFFFKEYDPGSTKPFGLKAKGVILKRGGGLMNVDPEREIQILFDGGYDVGRKAVLAAFGQTACAEELKEEGQRICLLKAPEAAPSDLSMAGIGEVGDGSLMFSCLYIDAEAARRRNGIVDQITK